MATEVDFWWPFYNAGSAGDSRNGPIINFRKNGSIGTFDSLLSSSLSAKIYFQKPRIADLESSKALIKPFYLKLKFEFYATFIHKNSTYRSIEGLLT